MTRRHSILARAGLAAALLAVAGAGPAADGRTIDIAARRFQFAPQELALAVGQPVTLRITSADVTHGLYQKDLGIDAEIVPGRTTEVRFTPAKPGRYVAICDHFCGSGHGNMRLVLVVQ